MSQVLSHHNISLFAAFVLMVPSTVTFAAEPNYDPPQPSADFGTPEATAKIAAASQPLDIVGVKLGMSLRAAQEAVKAHNSSMTLTPQSTFEFEALPGVAMTPAFSGQGKTANGGNEVIGVLATSVPNGAFVYGVWRDVWFGAKETRPTIDYIVTGLRKKYGQESVREENTLLLWLYDAQKQQVIGPKAKEIWGKCANHWMTGAEYEPGNIQRQMARGYYTVSDGRDYHGGICHSHSLVQARYSADQPQGASQPLIMNVKVMASNRQLEASGVTATNVLLTAESTKLAEKRKTEASKRAAPKF
jgi:hypothetical protein